MEALPGPAALLDTRGIVVAANAAWRQAPHPECPALCAEVGACVPDRLRDARGSGGDDADLLLRRLQSVLSGELTLCEGPGAPGGRVSVLCVGMERDGQRCALLVLFRRSASDHTPTDALAGAVVPCGRGAGETTAERARLRSEQRYRDLVMSMTDVVWEVDVRGRLIYVSPQLRDLLGIEPEEAIGRSLYS
ncbi:MAG TPA: PAS domain-containing protein, partial [Chthonomonadales bacterium]|nr:PAS domain-containing protein [Chthonomonadales bacterium]